MPRIYSNDYPSQLTISLPEHVDSALRVLALRDRLSIAQAARRYLIPALESDEVAGKLVVFFESLDQQEHLSQRTQIITQKEIPPMAQEIMESRNE